MSDKLRLEERLANARLLRAEANNRYLNESVVPYPKRDEHGRTPQDQFHFWSGVVETYEFLLGLRT